MNGKLDNLEQRLRILEDPLRLRWCKATGRGGVEPTEEGREECDVLRLRWHTEIPAAIAAG